MPVPAKQKKKVDKRKKPKQKQKQKQIVKQNVKVTVQSSGGSGGGGSSMPQSVPQPFMDRNGENVRLHNLVEQIARKVSAPAYDNTLLPIRSKLPAQRYNPANDAATLNDVYNDPIFNTDGFTAVNGEKIGGKGGRPKGSKNRPKIIATPVQSDVESDVPMFGMSSASVFQEPTMIPSRSAFNKQIAAQQALFGDN